MLSRIKSIIKITIRFEKYLSQIVSSNHDYYFQLSTDTISESNLLGKHDVFSTRVRQKYDDKMYFFKDFLPLNATNKLSVKNVFLKLTIASSIKKG